VSRHQAEKFAERDQAIAANRGYGYAEGAQTAAQPAPAAPPPAPPPAPSQGDSVEQLKQLAELHSQGVLTDEEFAASKKQILGI
jgi:hypothetical protein